FYGGARGLGGRAKSDEPQLFAAALEEPAAIVELSASIEEDRRMSRERSEPRDQHVAERVTGDLPHRAFRARHAACAGELLSLWSGRLQRASCSHEDASDS